MALVFLADETKNYLRDALADATDGLIRVEIYDDVGTQIDTTKTIAFSETNNAGEIDNDAEIVFEVPADTVVSGYVLRFYDSGTTTLTTGITYNFETQYNYTNGGTFTLSTITISVG